MTRRHGSQSAVQGEEQAAAYKVKPQQRQAARRRHAARHGRIVLRAGYDCLNMFASGMHHVCETLVYTENSGITRQRGVLLQDRLPCACAKATIVACCARRNIVLHAAFRPPIHLFHPECASGSPSGFAAADDDAISLLCQHLPLLSFLRYFDYFLIFSRDAWLLHDFYHCLLFCLLRSRIRRLFADAQRLCAEECSIR